jgi:hypothetical protein
MKMDFSLLNSFSMAAAGKLCELVEVTRETAAVMIRAGLHLTR